MTKTYKTHIKSKVSNSDDSLAAVIVNYQRKNISFLAVFALFNCVSHLARNVSRPLSCIILLLTDKLNDIFFVYFILEK